MQMVLNFLDDDQMSLFPDVEPDYCLYCEVIEVQPGQVYCDACADTVCRDLHELYARD